MKKRPIPQPAKGVIAMRPDVTFKLVARETHRTEPTVSRYFNGLIRPPSDFRATVSRLLEMPEEALFRAEGTQ